ncbi:MAG: hypothetical protein ACW9W3_10770 [Candidatus Nitrosopumilus sp. bin_68KS]
MNKSIFLIAVIASLTILVLQVPSDVYADVLSPKKQTTFGITAEDVICESGKFKVFKDRTNTVSCVNVDTVSKLVSLGWAKPVDMTKLNDVQTNLALSAGTINQLILTPISSDFGKQISKVSISSYDFVFDVCASSKTIVSPSILVRSDSETIHYEIPETVSPNSCVTSALTIKASNPNSISATLQNKGDISQTILTLSEKVESLKLQLQDAKKAFGKENTEDNQSISSKIIDLRKQLNDAREDLQRIYFILYTPEKSKDIPQKLSFLGHPIEGETATKISASPSVASPNTYDVFFEACAGMKQVRLPVITLSSDFETIHVRLGDKISPNTCQLSSGKIIATDPESITVNPSGNSDSSTKADELEIKINDLLQQLTAEKTLLKTLIHNPQRPADFDEQLSSHVENISKLRNDVIITKGEFSRILYQTYK